MDFRDKEKIPLDNQTKSLSHLLRKKLGMASEFLTAIFYPKKQWNNMFKRLSNVSQSLYKKPNRPSTIKTIDR